MLGYFIRDNNWRKMFTPLTKRPSNVLKGFSSPDYLLSRPETKVCQF